ncbi:MAG: hypothetical protein M0R73_07940 [Dehalococcoidia bacterium]|nr:hypothetical protein [Dehalococcoidia bacterium]
MRIGIDFDDTLCDFGGMLQTETLRRWEVDLGALRAAGSRPEDRLGKDWSKLVLELLETDLGLQMPVKPGAAEVTARLAERHELVILTARHDHESVLARQWIEANHLPIQDFHFTSRGPKHEVARALGLRVHLDDTARVFDSFLDHPTTGALLLGSIFDRGDEPAAHVRSVEHWHAFEDLVRTLEEREG